MYDPDHQIDHLEAMSKRDAWPAELDATHPNYLQRAKTRESATREPWCHATAWIKEWPLTPVGVNFLAPLLVHTPDVIRTVARHHGPGADRRRHRADADREDQRRRRGQPRRPS